MEYEEHPVVIFNRLAEEKFTDEVKMQQRMLANSDESNRIARENLREGRLSRIIATIALVVAILALGVAIASLVHSYQLI